MKKYYHLKTERNCETAARTYKCTNYNGYINYKWWVVIETEWKRETNAWYYKDFISRTKFVWIKLFDINLSYDL